MNQVDPKRAMAMYLDLELMLALPPPSLQAAPHRILGTPLMLLLKQALTILKARSDALSVAGGSNALVPPNRLL